MDQLIDPKLYSTPEMRGLGMRRDLYFNPGFPE